MTESIPALRLRASIIMERFCAANPHPKCELNHSSPFELLVAVVLSAQTTDKAVNQCTASLFKVATSPTKLYQLGEARLLTYIKRLGLAPTKAKHLIALSKQVIELHHGKVPHTYDQLTALPGVGRKTASVVLAEVFGQPTLAVDTHVFRVGRRLGFHSAGTPLAAEKQLLKVIDTSYLPRAHHWLILHGRYLCTARKPRCKDCPVNELCPSNGDFSPTRTHSKGKRKRRLASARHLPLAKRPQNS